jgi:hypothetical protein
VGGLVLDHLPAGDDHEHADEGGENDQRHGDAVDPQVVLDIEQGDPGGTLDKLHLGGGRIEAGIERQTHDEGEYGDDQRRPAGGVRRLVTAGEHQNTADDRQPDGQTEYGPVCKHS